MRHSVKKNNSEQWEINGLFRVLEVMYPKKRKGEPTQSLLHSVGFFMKEKIEIGVWEEFPHIEAMREYKKILPRWEIGYEKFSNGTIGYYAQSPNGETRFADVLWSAFRFEMECLVQEGMYDEDEDSKLPKKGGV